MGWWNYSESGLGGECLYCTFHVWINEKITTSEHCSPRDHVMKVWFDGRKSIIWYTHPCGHLVTNVNTTLSYVRGSSGIKGQSHTLNSNNSLNSNSPPLASPHTLDPAAHLKEYLWTHLAQATFLFFLNGLKCKYQIVVISGWFTVNLTWSL